MFYISESASENREAAAKYLDHTGSYSKDYFYSLFQSGARTTVSMVNSVSDFTIFTSA